MNSKRFIGIVLTIAMLATNCIVAGIVFAEGEPAGIALGDVKEAIIRDKDGDVTELYTSNNVTKTQNGGVITVDIDTKDLKKHTNGVDADGYWTGFAVVAPEGATKADVIFGEDTYTDVAKTIIDEDGTEGIALYTNAGSAAPKTTATITWLNDEDEAVTAATDFVIDISGVTLAIDYTPSVTKARVIDNANSEKQIYTAYSVTPSASEDGSIVVDIHMTELKEHKNGNNEDGYWTGFAVAAPEGAATVKGMFGNDAYNVPVTAIDTEGTNGVAFYTNLADTAPKTTATLQWFNAENEALSNVVSFEMNVDDITFNWIKADTVLSAIIRDKDGDVTELYTSNNVTKTQNSGVITVDIDTKDLKKHTNGVDAEGYWTGFAVAAPEGATKADVIFGEDTYTDVAKTIIDEDGTEGIALYTNAGSAAPKTTATITWLNDEDEAVTAATDFVIDLSDVTLAIDYTPSVTKARVIDNANSEKQIYTAYSVTPSASEDGSIVVDIDMTELKEHKNGNNEDGYWTGFAVVAPEGASYAKGLFGGVMFNEAVGDIDGNGKQGIAFYTNLADTAPKTTATLQWFNAENEALSNVVSFEMNVDDITFNWIKADTVLSAIIRDKDGDVTELYTSNNVTKTQNSGVITVDIDTKDLKKHTNGADAEGYWTGFAVAAPEGAIKADVIFGEDTYTDVAKTIIDEEGTEGIALYINAGSAAPKTTAVIRWFNEEGEAVTAATDFVIDISDVTLAGLPYIAADAVKPAKVVNQANSSSAPYSAYTVSASAADGVITVDIDMSDLKSHQNANGVQGYWTGFAVVAPDTAATMRYAFAESAAELELGSAVGTEAGVTTVEEAEKSGIAFYLNVNSSPKKYARLQWFDVNGEAITNATDFVVDISGVALYSAPGSYSGGTTSKPKEDKTKENKDDAEKAEDNKTESSVTPFGDVKATDWYYKAVKFVYEKGITNGISKNEFAPNSKVTRGQFITMLCRAYGISEMSGENFADCGSTWYTGYLAAAKQLGISNGVGDNMFAPEREITREEMVTLIYNYLKYTGKITDEATETEFADNDKISLWAKGAVAFANGMGYVKGKGNNVFDPAGDATRAELAQIFYNIFAE